MVADGGGVGNFSMRSIVRIVPFGNDCGRSLLAEPVGYCDWRFGIDTDRGACALTADEAPLRGETGIALPLTALKARWDGLRV